MDATDQRDHAEEAYWAAFCPACDSSPCSAKAHCAVCAASVEWTPSDGDDDPSLMICRDCGLDHLAMHDAVETV